MVSLIGKLKSHLRKESPEEEVTSAHSDSEQQTEQRKNEADKQRESLQRTGVGVGDCSPKIEELWQKWAFQGIKHNSSVFAVICLPHKIVFRNF